MQIEVFADVWCPFTHVGLRRFVEQRAHEGADVSLVVRAWPLELVNGRPMDPDFIAAEVEQIRASVAPDLFTGFDPARFPRTTLPALTLTSAAYHRSPATGEAVALELRDRLFERGEDVADPAVLESVARQHRVVLDDTARQAVEHDWEAGQARGVIGSPHFFTPDGSFFCPALDVTTVEGHLRITADPEGFHAFLRSCFTEDG